MSFFGYVREQKSFRLGAFELIRGGSDFEPGVAPLYVGVLRAVRRFWHVLHCLHHDRNPWHIACMLLRRVHHGEERAHVCALCQLPIQHVLEVLLYVCGASFVEDVLRLYRGARAGRRSVERYRLHLWLVAVVYLDFAVTITKLVSLLGHLPDLESEEPHEIVPRVHQAELHQASYDHLHCQNGHEQLGVDLFEISRIKVEDVCQVAGQSEDEEY